MNHSLFGCQNFMIFDSMIWCLLDKISGFEIFCFHMLDMLGRVIYVRAIFFVSDSYIVLHLLNLNVFFTCTRSY